jgi:hypothetical protein
MIDDMMFYYLMYTGVIDSVVCECVGVLILRMHKHRWNPLDSGLSQGVCYLG